MQEVLDGFRDNSITELYLLLNLSSRQFNYQIKGSIENVLSVNLPAEWVDNDIENLQYARYPLFAEASFNELKDILLLNTSLVYFFANSIIFNKEQLDYLTRIVLRNREFSQIRGGLSLLHYAAIHADIEVIQMYSWQAKHVDDLEIKCQSGKTPLDYARENNHLNIMGFLNKQISNLCLSQTETPSQYINQFEKPLSETNKEHIFNSLRRLSAIKSSNVTQKLIKAAIAELEFPPSFRSKLTPLQLAYKANKSSVAMKSLLEKAIETYFEEEGEALFKQLLNRALVPEDWTSSLMRKLAGDEIIIVEDPYVEATIKDGKIYWCIHFGNHIYFRKPQHQPFIEQARAQNCSWHSTWKEFRVIKDAGKRTGTVAITEERFVNAIAPNLNNDRSWGAQIWQELRDIKILNKNMRLSQAWHPFSNTILILNSIGAYKHLYQIIADILEQIANNVVFQEKISEGITIFRPARVSKTWTEENGLVRNRKKPSQETKIWDVSVYRELADHAIPKEQLPCIIDHIPSKSQVKLLCESKIQQENQKINNYASINPHVLRNTPSELLRLIESKLYWEQQLQSFIDDKKGLPLWSIYITKELDDTGDTTRVCKRDQAKLSFYSSVKKHIDDLKKGLRDGTLSVTEYLQALGAFRYLYSRMSKEIDNIKSDKIFIHPISFNFFRGADKSNERKEMDEFFIREIRVVQN